MQPCKRFMLGARRWWSIVVCAVLVGSLRARFVEGNDKNHKYKEGDAVVVWVNKVGPYYNPQESYPYYKLPFCTPDSTSRAKEKRPAHLGEVLSGHELRNTGIDIKFGDEQPGFSSGRKRLCSVKLKEDTAKQFRSAVKHQYLVNLYVDDLPIYGPLGSLEKDENGHEVPKIFVDQKFTIHFNDDRIIHVDYEPRDARPIEVGDTLDFTFEVEWQVTNVAFDDRFKKYLKSNFFEHQIHWFSIINSFMMVILLVGFVTLILIRTLKNDFAKYTPDEDDLEGLDNSLGDDSGWKQVRGDVFRAPKHLVLFSALFGTGCQLAVIVLMVILFSMAGPLHGDVYEERGEIMSTFIVCYALTSFVSGYMSGSYYRQFFTTPRAEQGSQWQKTMLLSVILVPSVLFPVVFFINLLASHYNTVNTIPFIAMLKMGLIWLFVSFPLGVVGSMFGRHWGGKASFPCRVNSIPRPIPEGAWYTKPSFVILAAGVLPFGSIFIEMYFILTSLWGYVYYYVFGFMLLVFIIMVVVLICTTIVAVYTVLNAENYHWQWVSFLSAGSTAIYMFLYSMYYFTFKTEQRGLLQVSYYFGYMGLFCAALAVMCGSIGVLGSTVFVKQIYRSIKVD